MASYQGERFGQRRPPLSVTIKSILEKYPDGQIFKEMIQNADDAGAKTVQFYIDSRQHGLGSLVHPALARFQGPALIAANDASFSDADWEGIQKLQQSIKVDDPFKVGRFGIGFNSVYHITDVPTIISGERVAYLDPQEEIWLGESGKLFRLAKLQGSDALAPFNGIAGFRSKKISSYPKTLFRFPLRDAPSDLSENVYSVQKLQQLTDALREEAKFLLLFLRSIHKIEVYKISSNGMHLLSFGVQIASAYQKEVEQKRSTFMDQLQHAHTHHSYGIPEVISYTAKYDIKVTDRNRQNSQSGSSLWLISTCVGSRNREVITAAKKQRLFPWVGTSLELPSTQEDQSPPGGRIYCFLPLPIEASSNLPVNVNGTFSLNDERRTLKLPGRERTNDPMAEWNKLLVTELLPPCYAMLLEESKQYLQPDQFYNAWPDVKRIQGMWKRIVKPVFSILFNRNTVWSTKEQQWIEIPSATFISKGTTISDNLQDVLTSCNISLVEVPNLVWRAIEYCELKVTTLSPALARSVMKNNRSSYKAEAFTSRLEILQYCLSDEDYSDLEGLYLLPLANGKFTCFKKSKSMVVQTRYLCSSKYPQELLPNIENLLVSLSDEELLEDLQDVAVSGETQLQMLNAHAVARLLSKCFPPEWQDKPIVSLLASESSFPKKWFKIFWDWVQSHNLSNFVNQHIVPVVASSSSGVPFKVSRLLPTSQSSVVYISDNDVYSTKILSTLSKFEVHCIVADEVDYLRHRKLVLYLNKFNTSGVLTAIANVTKNIYNTYLSFGEALELQKFLALNLSKQLLSDAQKEVLHNLPLFKTLNTGQLCSVVQAAKMSWGGKAVLQPSDFSLSSTCLPSNLIVLSNNPTSSLLLEDCESLVYLPSTLLEFLVSTAFQMIQSDKFPHSKIDLFMEEVLKRFLTLKDQHKTPAHSIVTNLASLPFLKTKTSSPVRKMPKELYDPLQPELKKLYEGESVFPLPPFNQIKYLQYLCESGLRTTVKAQEVYAILENVSTEYSEKPQRVEKIHVKRARAVLSFIRKHPGLLLEKVTTTTGFQNLADAFMELFKQKNCLPVLAQPVEGYPKCLVWKGSSCVSHLATLNNLVLLCSSKDMETLPYIVGSRMYVVECPSILGSSAMSDSATPINPVLSHFKRIIEHQNEIETSMLNALVEDVYSYLLKYLEHLKKVTNLSVDLNKYAWIWIKKRHKFVSAEVVALKQHATLSKNLSPYLHLISEPLQRFSSLFTYFGVHQSFTDNQIIYVLKMIKEEPIRTRQSQYQHIFTLVVQILEWLTKNKEQSVLKTLKECGHLYVPVDTKSKTVYLVEVDKVVYTDLDILKTFHHSEGQATYFIHPKVAHLALTLGVTPLSTHLNIAEDAFGDVGQHEPLVTRLKNILRDYKDGLTIIKELLQNADDAEATELNICYDARHHVTKENKLIYPGMSKCNGPALIVHNNAVFTDEDFENITKLAGASKQNKPLKIGKFGVGFCSVYHITDVPSFISRDWLYIFDPTLSHLKKEVIDRSRPGKKLRFTEKLVQHSSQLQPYTNFFGFDPKHEFQGTMFRFPFRTSKSELSSVIYDDVQIKVLLSTISKAGSKLLLFLKSVCRITFSQITSDDRNPTILCDIRKDRVCATPTSISTLPNLATDSIDQTTHASDLFRQENSCCITKICIESNFRRTGKKTDELWLISSHNTNARLDRATKQASCSVACVLIQSSQKYIPMKVNGEVFCFLPLTLETGLPVHISCNFAVLNDRTGVHSTPDSQSENKSSAEVQWNRYLMKEVIPKAYLTLLSTLQVMCHQHKISMDKYKFYMLWPLKESLKTHTLWDSLLPHLYRLISESNLFFSSCIQTWRPLDACKIISPEVLCQTSPSSAVVPKCVINVIESLQYPLVEIPQEVITQFSEVQYLGCIINEDEFLSIFFAHIQRISIDTRNDVLFCLFKAAAHSNPKLQQCIERQSCVPCTPDGLQLKKCSEVVDPNSEIAELFDQKDGAFPIARFYTNRLVHIMLLQAKMITDRLPWTMIIERALAIEENAKRQKNKNSFELLAKRSALVIKCVSNNLINKPLQSVGLPPEASNLIEISFLPVMKKPNTYPEQLQWEGEGYRFLSCANLMKGDSSIFLAGSQVSVLCEFEPEDGGCGSIPKLVKQAFRLRSEPNHVNVLNHFSHIIDTYSTATHMDKHQKKWIEKACNKMYAYLEKHLLRGTVQDSDLSTLKATKCVWTGTQFVSTTSVATNWNHNGPFLLALPPAISSKNNLLQALGIGKLSVDQLLKTLKQMYDTFGARKLGKKEMKILPQLVVELVILLGKTELDPDQLCYLPDEHCRIRDTRQLVYNDAPWCELDRDCYVVHDTISRKTAIKLRVKPIRTKALELYESSVHYFQEDPGDEFGQREDLTQRIKNILSEYPCDVTVIKELLQNADDAKASKLYVILDKRSHGIKKLPSSEWKDLQGPALLVWNDKGFSDADFKGIQQVGLGSKRQKWDSIGKFGVGFNVAYHLTDCPSFFTNGNALCVFDPHCRYVPGANQITPGRKYDVNDGFWKNWADLKSAYLYEDIDGCPQEIKGSGTLFRFPLRHNDYLVKKSQLIMGEGNSRFGTSNEPLSPQIMESKLNDWARQIKEALLFLNHVTDLKFFNIPGIGTQRNSQMKLTHHFKVELDQADLDKRKIIQEKAIFFTRGKPCLISYPLSLCEELPQKDFKRFFVQQGIGDVQNPDQHWEYLQDMKPVHGIAARIDGNLLKGSLFCFLPLARKSHLPVNINGNFILDAGRSGIWQSRDLDEKDNRMLWNQKLFQSLASSYAIFLNNIREHFVSSEQFKSRDELLSAVKCYYDTFPRWDTEDSPTDDLKLLSILVYEQLGKLNFKMLASLTEVAAVDLIEHSYAKALSSRQLVSPIYRIQWKPLTDTMERNKQVYFWEGPWNSELLTIIVKCVGMSLTVAPMWIKLHFSGVDVELPQVSPNSVYEYYSNFYEQITQNRNFPCHIASTTFGIVKNFLLFTKYLLREVNLETESGSYFEFPQAPFGLPLLFAADEQLRMFDEGNKAIVSHYTSIFTNVLDKFLHPAMLGIKYLKSYFVEPNKSNWLVIMSILRKTLPPSLCTRRVYNSNDHINIESVLSPLWNCFAREKVFSIHISSILQEWALIPSTNNQLFALPSGEEAILPAIPPTDHESRMQYVTYVYESQDFKVLKIMEKCGMPICDVTVSNRSLCEQFCPLFSLPDKILANLYLVFQSGEFNIAEISKEDINTLFSYFRRIPRNNLSLFRLKSLPLFEGVDNKYYAINDETFLWPELVSLEGKDVISRKAKAVFLQQNGEWSTLGDVFLGIKRISPTSFYINFIFPYFSLLCEQDRISQLHHIRNTWDTWRLQNRSDSAQFVESFKQLPCLLKQGSLKPVHDFCDPTCEVFSTFPDMFDFPPQQYFDEKWLNFFRKVDLRTKVTQEEFIQLCEKISLGNHDKIVESSKVLLDVLFSEIDWHTSDQQEFLDTVSQIAFVCAEPLNKLSTINPIFKVNNVMQQGSKIIYLTCLRKSAGFKHCYIAWTQMPVVKLPHNASGSLCKKLGMCIAPSCLDVVQNIVSISQSLYSNFNLFEHHSRGCLSEEVKDEELLLNVLIQNFLHLMNQNCSMDETDILQHVPCIPVSSVGETMHIPSPVLVCPLQVIASTSDEVKQFVPFINPLPSGLYSVFPAVLSHIGVTSEIQVLHVTYALLTIYEHIQFPYDPNTAQVIERLLKKMYDLLQDVSNKPDFGDMILYLPSTERQLKESKKLLYNDTVQACQYDLSDVPYSFFSLLNNKQEYDFNQNKFCEMLPESVRPLPVSTICSYRLHESCVPKRALSDFATKLKQAFEFQGFGDCALMILKNTSNPNSRACEQFAQSLDSFSKSVEVFTVDDLIEDIYLKIIEPPSKIGSADVDFLLVDNDTDDSVQLYIDDRVDGLKWNFFKSLTKALVTHVSCKAGIDVNSLCEPDKAIEMLLRVSSSDELLCILNREGIDTTQLNLEDPLDLTPTLGASIPEHWHHRLQADIYNVFRPQEWVGFESRENHYVFALVKHQINPGYSEIDTDDDLPTFLIQVREDDEEGKDVSIIELHKFLRIKQIQQDDGSTEDILYNPDSIGAQIWDVLDDKKMNDIMIAISTELKRIWKIKNKHKRKKAIKATYLKWHPDKNLHNPPATKAFQFLQRQINRLQQSLLLEDPIEDEWETEPEPPHTSYWDNSFNLWNHTASRHSTSWRKEQNYRQSRSGDEYDQNADSESQFEWKWEKNMQTVPESSIAMVWLQQAEHDLTALYLLMAHTDKQVSAHVCFLSHQVIEKSLKAGMYKECGLHPSELKNHVLAGHAGALEGLQPIRAQGLLKLVANFEANKYYLKTRYPNVHIPPSVPSKIFGTSDATQAKETASTVLGIIRNVIYCEDSLKAENSASPFLFPTSQMKVESPSSKESTWSKYSSTQPADVKPADLPPFDSSTIVTASGIASPSTNEHELPTVTHLNDIITFECNSVGQEYKLVEYDIIVRVPPDAIPEGEKVRFEIATCLYGPFKFPEDKRPISPIIWLCTKNKVDLKRPIEVVLPHILTGLMQDQCDQYGVCFAKADHAKSSAGTPLYDFGLCDTKAEVFNNEGGSFGALKTNHCCYLCILAKKNHDTALQAGYCLSRIEYTKRQDNATLYGVYFCATFCLSTCMDVLKKQFPNDGGYEITSRHPFKFEDGSDPCIQLDITDNPSCKTALTPKIGKISLSEIDFWDQRLSKEDMECRQNAKMYPPWCRLEVYLMDKEKATVLAVSFLGCKHKSLDMEIMFPLGTPLPRPKSQSDFISAVGKGTSSSVISLKGEEKPKLYQLQFLKLGDKRIKIVDLIQADWKIFARYLHFEEHIIRTVHKESHPSVNDGCCSILNKWLEGSGLQPANWKSLIEILYDFGKTEVADFLQTHVGT